jgi:hypothetical protein
MFSSKYVSGTIKRIVEPAYVRSIMQREVEARKLQFRRASARSGSEAGSFSSADIAVGSESGGEESRSLINTTGKEQGHQYPYMACSPYV